MDYEMDSSEEYQARECKSIISEEEKKESCSGCGFEDYCWGTDTTFSHHGKDDSDLVEKVKESIATGSSKYGDIGLKQ